MHMPKKPVVCGEGELRYASGKKVILTRTGAQRYGYKIMPKDADAAGFHVVVADCGGYFRINFAK